MEVPILTVGAQHSGAGFYIEDNATHDIDENAQVIFIEAPSVVNQFNPFTACIPYSTIINRLDSC
jgi:hypothetical protein